MWEDIEEYLELLQQLTDGEAEEPITPGKWSPKQILGHLIDSAANNHQRFVRAHRCERLEFPAYQQDEWVNCQCYDERPWSELIEFWKTYNLHLLHVIDRIDEDDLATPCVVNWYEPPNNVIPLSQLIDEYWEHMEHHLGQIRSAQGSDT